MTFFENIEKWPTRKPTKKEMEETDPERKKHVERGISALIAWRSHKNGKILKGTEA